MTVFEPFRPLLLKTGKYALIVVILAVAFNYWGVMVLDKIPIPHFVDILYGYMIMNGIAAGPFIYFEKKARIVSALCPQCKEPLEAITSYNCTKCGKLEYRQTTTGSGTEANHEL